MVEIPANKECETRRSVMFLVYMVKEEKYVIEERTREDSYYKGLFIIPAGHVENGETSLDTLKRELLEEQNIEPLEYIHLDRFKNKSLSEIIYDTDAYLIQSFTGDWKNNETDKCNLHQMTFEEANEKMEYAYNKYVLLMAELLLRKNS